MKSQKRPDAGLYGILYPLLPTAIAGAFSLCSSLQAQVATNPRGFVNHGRALSQPAKGWVGLDILPGGRMLTFDGKQVVALDPQTGKVVATYATLPTAVFGSDLRISPSGRFFWFCESSTGAVYRYEFATSKLSPITSLAGNLSIAFSPLDGDDFAYISADPGFLANSRVYRVDGRTGGQDLIAAAAGYAGPVIFDKQGSLYMAPASTKIPSKGLGKVLRWSAAQVRSAIGATSLLESNATLWASGFDSAFDMEFDHEGTLYVSDVSFGASHLFEIPRSGGKTYAREILKPTGQGVTYLRFHDHALPFERFGASGPAFYVLSTDYATNHALWKLEPERPQLTWQKLSGGQIGYTISGAQPLSWVMWLHGDGLPTEMAFPLGNAGLLFPQIGVAVHKPFILLHSKTDAGGKAMFQLALPQGQGLRFTSQALVGPIPALPGGTAPSIWVSSNPALVQQGP
mgnify:CR=1 FL=1